METKNKTSYDPPKKWTVALMVLGVLLAIGSLSAAAYVGFYLPRQPENILARAIGNTVSEDVITSGQIEGTVSLENAQLKDTVDLTFDGASDGASSELNVDLSAGSVNVAADLRRINQDLYFQASGLDEFKNLLGFLGKESLVSKTYQTALATLNNQWVVVDDKEVQKEDARQLAATETVSAEDSQAILNAYKKNTFLEITNVYEDQDVHNQTSYHYLVTVNKAKLQNFLQEIKDQDIQGLPKFTDKDISAIGNSNIDKLPFDVWIDKKRNIIDQLSFTWESGGTALSARVALFNVNQPVTIIKPNGAKTVQQLLVGDNLTSFWQTNDILGPVFNDLIKAN